MAKLDIVVIDGDGYRWQKICELLRQRFEAWKATQAQQLALFEPKSRLPSRRRAGGSLAVSGTDPVCLNLSNR